MRGSCAHCAPSKVPNDWKSVETNEQNLWFGMKIEGVTSSSKLRRKVLFIQVHLLVSSYLGFSTIEREMFIARNISLANSILSIQTICYLLLLYLMSTWTDFVEHYFPKYWFSAKFNKSYHQQVFFERYCMELQIKIQTIKNSEKFHSNLT